MLKQMKDKVAFLLKEYPRLRDDDFMLVAMVYKTYYGVGYEDGFLYVMKQGRFSRVQPVEPSGAGL